MILVNAGMGNKYSTFRVRHCPCWHLLADKGSIVSQLPHVEDYVFVKSSCVHAREKSESKRACVL